MGTFVQNARGFRMYTPAWQQNRGASLKKMNSSAASSSFGGAMFGSVSNAAAGSANLAARIANQRIQTAAQERLRQVNNSLDMLA